ncbi:MAG TPA: hypothetical protein VM261_15175 [Kofleriaceae bacterium]|nr:hypothetical protein [Kofleriaceae bacterium]
MALTVSKAAWCIAALLLAACPGKGSSTPRRDAGDAGAITGSAPITDAAVATDVTDEGDGDGGSSGAGKGSLTVKVLWPTAPAAVRASPGYTSCHTPRRARARIGTLHGVAGAMVVLDGIPAGKAAPGAKPLRLTMRDCAIDPVASLARLGGSLEIQTQDVAHSITVVRVGKPWLEDDIKLAPVTLASTQLPVLGHTVSVALQEPGAIQVAMDGAADDAAWVLVPPHHYAGVTDDVGALGLRDVPPGSYTLVAWLPPAAGFPEQRAVANVVIKAGEDAEATLTFAPASP